MKAVAFAVVVVLALLGAQGMAWGDTIDTLSDWSGTLYVGVFNTQNKLSLRHVLT